VTEDGAGALILYLETDALVRLYGTRVTLDVRWTLVRTSAGYGCGGECPRYAVNAVKKGIQRGTPKSEQGTAGCTYAWTPTSDTVGAVESGALISAKDEP
jgi:hypothetical protein